MRILQYLEEACITFLMTAMTLIAFVQVIARYAFNYNFVWALELTGVMFAWLIFIGMSYGVRVGAHIGVDALVKSLGARAARMVGSVAAALCIVYALLVAFGSFQYVQKMYDVGILMQDMPVQSWIPRAILPVGFLLLAFRFSQVFWRLVTGQEAHLLGDEAKEALKLRPDEPLDGVQK
jgi:C4-dicarboxylate transporter DctQ subunit